MIRTQSLLRWVRYRKIPKISPGAYILQRPFLRGLFLEGLIFGGAYLRREICVSKSIGLALYIVGRKFTVFSLFYLYLRAIFQFQAPKGAFIWRGDLPDGFLRYRLEGLIFGGVYTWRGLFSEFYGTFEPASLRLDRGGTGYKLKMSIFSCSAANTPHRFFLLDKNFYRQDSNKFYKLLETSFNVARKKMIHIRFFVQFLSLKAMKPIKIFLWGITPTLLSSNPLVTVYGNYRGLSGPHLSIAPSTSQDTQCINQCSVSPVWTPYNFFRWYFPFWFEIHWLFSNCP